ncbi:hypothetical protein DL240_15220 [Lujinxingia litoralis]|uniref:DUF2325 domain-containing protein n=1 Tax=Lujinxingia litoralis TaxID=2211119 RepID=A0A328C5S1_9DELT|nr:DUF2325 domain-containing protein [Lujinxingia litoralis]RAL20666.1 hypothetical protein DL240_15220 [Lujinxingia litoralis]
MSSDEPMAVVATEVEARGAGLPAELLAEVGPLVWRVRALRARQAIGYDEACRSARGARAHRGELQELDALLEGLLAELGARVFDHLEDGGWGGGLSRAAGDEEDEAPAEEAPEEGAERQQGAPPTAEPPPPPERARGLRVPTRLIGGQVRAGAASGAPTRAELVAHLLPDVREQLGAPPRRVRTYTETVGELGRLKAATEDEALCRWEQLPAEVQVVLAGFIVARFRHLQEETPADCRGVVEGDRHALTVIQSLRAHVGQGHVGYVHGLARDHGPERGSWAADAVHYHRELARQAHEYYGEPLEEARRAINPERALGRIRALIDQEPSVDRICALVEDVLRSPGGLRGDDPRLVRLMRPFRDHLSGASLSRLRQAIDAHDAAQQAEPEFEEGLLPPDWPWREAIRRSRVVMVGGDSRPGAQARIEQIFEPASFEWITVNGGENVRQVQALAGRMQQGSVDVVILLTAFVSHKISDQVTEAAGKSNGVHLVYINRGYGIARLRQGFEDFVPCEPLGADPA